MKKCSWCKVEKDESEFTKKKSEKDGLYCWCKQCSREYQKLIDLKPEAKKKKREYYLQNKLRILENGKKYRLLVGRDVMNAYQRTYNKTARGKAAGSRTDHTSRMKCNGISTLSSRQWGNIISMQGNRCAICNIEFTFQNQPTKDCIVPISAGGFFTYGNVQALCNRCNNKKGADNPIASLFALLF